MKRITQSIRSLVFLALVLLVTPIHGQSLADVPLAPEDFTTPPAESMPGILWFWHQTEMTPEVIHEQMNQMHEAGFRGIMMFPLASNPKFYTEEFYELFEVVLQHASKLGMSIWLTNDSAIPTGHGATMVVPGGTIHDELTLEPRPDLRAEKLLHVNQTVTGGRTVNLAETFPGYHDLPPTIRYYQGAMDARATEEIIGNRGGNWIDYRYQIDVTPLPWSGNPLVPGNYTETAWMFRADRASSSGYAWAISDRSRLGNGVAALRKLIIKDGRIVKELAPVRLPFEIEEKPYKIETVMRDDRIETFIDGVSIDVTVDDTFKQGTVGFYLPRPCRGRYDNVCVRFLGGDLIYQDNCDDNGQWRFWGPTAHADEVFSVAAVPVIDGMLQAKGIVDLTDFFQATPAHWSAPAGEWSIEFFMNRKDKEMPFNYPDLYHPDTIRRHLQITYGEIVRRYPWAIGKTFKGFWSDEPHSTASKGKAWSPQFEKKLTEAGHEIGPTLAAVFNDLGREGRRLQAPYYQQVVEGWAEPFARLQGEWCESHGLDFMTNPVIDSSPPYGAFSGGDGLQMNQWSSAPGVDAIYGQILPGKRSLISRWATSSAHQTGCQHVLYEVFGGYGWDVTPNTVRYVNGFLNVRGCNRASYHAYWTNPDAVGYAPPFDPSNTWWSVQDELNLWNGRLQEMNRGKALADVALMNPTSTLYADEMNLDGRLMNPAFNDVYYELEDNQFSFDLLDETSLNNNPIMQTKAAAVHDGIQVGQQRYRVVILPRAHTLSLEALQTLDAMIEKGGVVIASHLMPEEELEGRDDQLQALLTKLFGENPSANPHRYGRGWTAFAKDKDEIPVILDRVTGPFGQSRMRTVRFEKRYPNIRVLKQERKNAFVYLLMNEGQEAVAPKVTFYDEQAPEIWNPENGSRMPAPIYSTHGEWGVQVPLRLEPFQTKVVVFMKAGPDPASVPHLIDSPVEVLSVVADSDESFSATILTDSAVDLELQGSYQGRRYVADFRTESLSDPIRLDASWELTFDDAPDQRRDVKLGYWTKIRSDYSGTASYTTRFDVPADALGRDQTLRGAIGSGRGNESRSAIGSGRGNESQAAGLVASSTTTVNDLPTHHAQRKWQVDLGTVHDVASIEINGQLLEPMLWPPYTQELTPYLRTGENRLKVQVTNTLANKHGQAKPSGLLGPVTLSTKHSRQLEFRPVKDSGYLSVVKPSAPSAEDKPIVSQFTYRNVGDAALRMKLWYPPGWKVSDEKLPAAVFFFGGGWYLGATSQFDGIAPYLADRGMIVLAPEYRTHKDGVPPSTCLEDAKSAMRYIYKHADQLGLDTSMIAAGGRSAGGHLAAATAFSQGFNAPGDDLDISCKPSALILFNPVIDNGPGGFRHEHVKDYWEDFSPLHTITTNPPPTIVITGDKDQYTPIETAQKYKARMEAVGGRCELVVHEGGVHGSPFHPEYYERTLNEMDRFLVILKYLKPRQ